MSNTRRKFFLGLLVLSSIPFALFLLIKNLKGTKQEPATLPLPQRSNNPFAIIQQVPSNWIGLTGKEPNGFLKFDTPVNGVRAGFLNLFNRYISKQRNTIRLIADEYSGGAVGYADGLAKLSGIPVDALIEWPGDAVALGRAIERMENGSQWVSSNDFNEGLNLARKYLGK